MRLRELALSGGAFTARCLSARLIEQGFKPHNRHPIAVVRALEAVSPMPRVPEDAFVDPRIQNLSRSSKLKIGPIVRSRTSMYEIGSRRRPA